MVFVLWATNFDEAAASVFVSELRDAGLRVQVVGLHGQQIAGARGLVLGADMWLDEALRYGRAGALPGHPGVAAQPGTLRGRPAAAPVHPADRGGRRAHRGG